MTDKEGPTSFLSEGNLFMENPSTHGRSWPVAVVAIVFGLAASSCCIASEIMKAKVEDMKLDGKFCSLPRTPAFGLGITALACFLIAQVIATSVNKSPAAATFFSWISFGMATVLLGTGSSMNDWQPYGKGWMGGDCYVVKTGVYTVAAALIAATLFLMLAFRFTPMTRMFYSSRSKETCILSKE